MGILSDIIGGGSAPQVSFNPYDVSTGVGSANFQDGSVSTSLDPRYQGIVGNLLGQSQQQFQAAQSPEATAGFLSQLLGPEFQRQQLSQESRLRAQGLLGATAGQNRMAATSQAQNQALLQGTLGAQQQFYNQGQGLLSSALGIEQAPLQYARLGGQLGQTDLGAQQFNAQAQAQADQARSGFFQSLVGGGLFGVAGTDFSGLFGGGGPSPSAQPLRMIS